MANLGDYFSPTVPTLGNSPRNSADVRVYQSQFGKPRDGRNELFRVGGHFSVSRQLGQGGFCCVFQAIDERNGRRVAIKLLRPDRLSDVESVRRFRREQRNLIRLGDLPGVVSFLNVGELRDDENAPPFLCMEYVPGRTLREKLDLWRVLPIRESMRILREVCVTLERIHGNGYTHRDIKPANLLEDASNAQQIFIADLGLAYTSDDIAADVSRGQVIGTFSYLAPERLKDRSSDASPAVDWFSVGCVLYEMLTGERAYPLGTMNNPTPPERPVSVRSLVPPELSELAMRLIALDPTQRPRDAIEVLSVLARIQPQILEMREPSQAKWPRISTARVALAIDGAWPLKLKLPAAWTPCPDSLVLGLASRRQLSLELYEAVSRGISLVSTFRAELRQGLNESESSVAANSNVVNVKESFPLVSALVQQAINVCDSCGKASVGLPRFSTQVTRTREALERFLGSLQNWVLEENLASAGGDLDELRWRELERASEACLSELVWLEV